MPNDADTPLPKGFLVIPKISSKSAENSDMKNIMYTHFDKSKHKTNTFKTSPMRFMIRLTSDGFSLFKFLSNPEINRNPLKFGPDYRKKMMDGILKSRELSKTIETAIQSESNLGIPLAAAEASVKKRVNSHMGMLLTNFCHFGCQHEFLNCSKVAYCSHE